MSRHNHCFVIGNLGQDPVERSRNPKSGPVVGFSVAENVQTFDSEARQYRTLHTNWFNVTAFGALADRVKAGLKKGDRVAVQGRMKVTKFTTKSGEERTGFEILADEVAIWQPLAAAATQDRPASEEEPPKEALPF